MVLLLIYQIDRQMYGQMKVNIAKRQRYEKNELGRGIELERVGKARQKHRQKHYKIKVR